MVEFPALPPYPGSSFQSPVPAPVSDPDAGVFVSVCFNPEWLPYVIGCLKQLTNEATWDVATKSDMDTVLQQVDTLMGLFSEGCPVSVTGMIEMFGGDTAPSGWLFCDGSEIDRTTYVDLFNVIGTTFGVGDGTDTFNLPDMRGRIAVGVGQQSGGTDFALADTGGEETHVLSVNELAAHSHTDTGHTHLDNNATSTIINGGLEAPAASAIPSVTTTGSGSANLTDTGDDDAHNNLQPYLALNYIIKD